MNILSIITSHDASVTFISEGKLKYFSKEERLSGFKHDKGWTKSLDYIIKNDFKIDLVILNSTLAPDPFHRDYLESILRKQFDCEVIHMEWDHHLCHAYYAYYNSKFDESLVLVVDRNGTRCKHYAETETIFKINQNYEINSIYKNFIVPQIGKIDFDKEIIDHLKKYIKNNPRCDVRCDSTLGITQVYESATTLIGENVLNNGKVMGLSSYGEDKEHVNLFYNGIADSHLFMRHNANNHETVLLKEHYGNETTKIPEGNYKFYADYAFQVQKQTQEEVLRLVKKYVEKTNIKKVCVTGGYGLNVVTNHHLIKNLPEVEFYFEPIADDSSISLGSAIYAHKNEVGTIPKLPSHTFFNHIPHNLKQIKGKRASLKDIAKLLVDQQSVAIFNGQAECGPRALGNRSILFDPRNPDAKNIINQIKQREWYRPFAGCVLEEDAKEYFEMYHLTKSPNMTISFPVLTDSIPGITHVDSTCRIQTVNNSIPHLYNLLKEFKKLTGCSVLLNTSFNLAGDPLVESPQDAIKTFKNSKINYLWFVERNIIIDT